jgi:hypothetical protein
MSTIKGLSGPRLPLATPSAAPQTSATSFLSRVQTSASGVSTLPRQANAPAVSGRDIVSKAIAAQKDAQGTPAADDPAAKQQAAIMQMAQASVMNTMQSIFAGFGEGSSNLPKEEWG